MAKPHSVQFVTALVWAGLVPVPGIAGRSPSYVVRQLYDIQHGNRAGAWSALMANVVANLDEEDMVSVAAYIASLPP
jgi:cytochrome c553